METHETVRAEKSRLHKATVDIAVAVIVGVIVKLIETRLSPWFGQWSRLAVVTTFVFVGLYVIYVLWRLLAPTIQDWQCERRIENQIREPVLSVASLFKDAMSQGFIRGAANILHPLTDSKVIDARLHNQYLTHFGTLHSSVNWIIKDVQEGLPAVDGLIRLLDLHRDYSRVCSSLASAVTQVERPNIHKAWDEIRDHTNMIADRLSELMHKVQIKRGMQGPAPYIERVPRA